MCPCTADAFSLLVSHSALRDVEGVLAAMDGLARMNREFYTEFERVERDRYVGAVQLAMGVRVARHGEEAPPALDDVSCAMAMVHWLGEFYGVRRPVESVTTL